MAKRNQKRLKRRREKRRQKRRAKQISDLQKTTVQDDENKAHLSTSETKRNNEYSILANVIRGFAIIPIILFVSLLSGHHLLPSIPHWFQPVVDKQIPMLTLSAGNLGIMGVLIGTKGRNTWSTLALLGAALATFTIGYRGLGLDEDGNISVGVITIIQFLLYIPALLAERISGTIQSFRDMIRNIFSLKRLINMVLIVIFIVLISYNQSQDEHYIRNWLLIPIGVFTGIILFMLALWFIVKYSISTYQIIKRLILKCCGRLKK